jgi:AcrR family transcriptional regulator
MLAFWQRGYEGTSMADLVQAMGIASARIYAAFGSKQALFREAIQRYESGAGCFADRALAEESLVRDAISRMLRDAATTYTEPSRPQGCMVVMAATNFAQENEEVAAWLAVHRRQRTQSIIDRLQRAMDEGELRKMRMCSPWATSMPRTCTVSQYRLVTACRARACWLLPRPLWGCWTKRCARP